MRWLAVVMAIACIALILLGISGCRFPKDSVLSAYESVVQFAGQFALTPAIQLQGVRSFGESHIEGAYTAQYEGYSGTEYLFGDTSTLARAVDVELSLDAESGGGTLFLMTGARKMEVLFEGEGSYEDTLELPAGGGYIGFTGKGLTGTLNVTLTRCPEVSQDEG